MWTFTCRTSGKSSCLPAGGPEAAEEDEERGEEAEASAPPEEDGTSPGWDPEQLPETGEPTLCVCVGLQENQERAKRSSEQQRQLELQFRQQQRERAQRGARPLFLNNGKNVGSLRPRKLQHSRGT